VDEGQEDEFIRVSAEVRPGDDGLGLLEEFDAPADRIVDLGLKDGSTSWRAQAGPAARNSRRTVADLIMDSPLTPYCRRAGSYKKSTVALPRNVTHTNPETLNLCVRKTRFGDQRLSLVWGSETRSSMEG
jgi:hypothetical protein